MIAPLRVATGVALLLCLTVLGPGSRAGPAATAPQPRYLTIASAEPFGAYHRRALAICRAVNEACMPNGPRCVVEPTEGSQQNLTLLEDGIVDFAILQSDLLTPDLRNDACPSMRERTVCSAESLATSNNTSAIPYQEALFVFVRAEETAQTFREFFHDTEERRSVSLGPEASGTRTFSHQFLTGVTVREDRAIQFDQGILALCQGEIDAVFRVTDAAAHTLPTALLGGYCHVKLLAIDACLVKALVTKKEQSYCRAEIRFDMPTPEEGEPAQHSSPVSSLGPQAILVASRKRLDPNSGTVDLVCQAATLRADDTADRAGQIERLQTSCDASRSP